MNEIKEIEFTNSEFNCVVENDIAILTIKGNAFNSISSTARNLDIIPWFDEVEQAPNVRGVLILNENDAMSEKSYNNFFELYT